MTISRFGLWLTVMMIGALLRPANAQTYPDRPITLIVQFAPGTTTDIVGRRFGELLSKELGVPVVTLNRAGAGGTVGVGALAQATPDGYTIGLVNLPALVIIPHVQKVAYDPLSAFHHVGVIGPYEYGVYVSADSPWRTWEELVAYAKDKPGAITYATPGKGTTNHLIMTRIGKDLGLDWVHAPYKGDGEIIPNVLGGHVQVAVGSPGAVVPQVKGGKLRLLLVTSRDRWRDLPDVPTMQEKGFKYFQASFLSLAIPAKTPEPIQARLDAASRKVLTDPAVVAEMRDRLSTTVVYQPGSTYAAFVRDQFDSYRDLVKGMQLE